MPKGIPKHRLRFFPGPRNRGTSIKVLPGSVFRGASIEVLPGSVPRLRPPIEVLLVPRAVLGPKVLDSRFTHGPPRLLPIWEYSRRRGFFPHFVGGIQNLKSLLLYPYPAFPPYNIRTLHPGIWPTWATILSLGPHPRGGQTIQRNTERPNSRKLPPGIDKIYRNTKRRNSQNSDTIMNI